MPLSASDQFGLYLIPYAVGGDMGEACKAGGIRLDRSVAAMRQKSSAAK